MQVYALMIETQVEGVSFMDIESLHTTYDGAEAAAQKRNLNKWNYYIEPLEVLA